MSEPIIVFYKSEKCGYCTSLSKIWDKPESNSGKSIVSAIKEKYPNMRFFTVQCKEMDGKFDENTIPKDLLRYGKWFPMILLIPGNLWDRAMSKLGPNNDVKLFDGIQIMNALWKDNGKDLELKYEHKYDIRNPLEFVKWIDNSYQNENFRIAQGLLVEPKPQIEVPIIQANPIQMISPFVHNKNKPYILNNNDSNNVCSMRIIGPPNRKFM